MTEKQRDIYDFLMDFIQDTGYPPTVREIGERFGITSPNGVMCHLSALKRKGLINWQERQSRTITITGYRLELVEE